MNVLVWLRRRVAAFFLRGWFLEAWVAGKMRRLERRYAAELIKHSQRPRSPEQIPKITTKAPLRDILLIGDFQWEGKELLPELNKICPTTSLNLHPLLAAGDGGVSSPERVTAAVRDFLSAHSALEPQAILFYARPNLLSEEVFHVLRRRWSCPLLGMNLDDKIQFLDYGLFSDANDNYQRWARLFDVNITNVRAAVDWYSDRKLPVHYMAEGYSPKTDFPEAGRIAHRYEMAFVGSRRAEREQIISRLREYGVPIEAVGTGWPNAAAGEQPEKIYRETLINLGIGFASPSQALTTLKTRDFECPGAGVCYLTTYNWELALHYEIGQEILCYRSLEEIVELFSYYRRRPDACLQIAQAAYRRCLRDHTWEKRFRTLFTEMGLV